MRWYLRGLFIFLLFPAVLWAGEERPVTSSDFAKGYTLTVQKEGLFYQIDLPEDLYKTIRSDVYRDIAVFNAAGQRVTHTIEKKIPGDTVVVPQEVSFFPVHYDMRGDESSGLAFKVVRDSGGTIITVDSSSYSSNNNEDTPVGSYLLDLSGVEKKVRSIEFFWEESVPESSIIHRLTLQQSNNLESWTDVTKDAALAVLKFGDEQIEKRSIAIGGRVGKYLRLIWAGKKGFTLTKVIVHSGETSLPLEHNWVQLGPGEKSSEGEQKNVLYTSSYHLPVTSLKVDFSQKNSLAGLLVESRKDEQALWQKRCNGLFYKLSIETDIFENELCTFRETGDKFWRVRPMAGYNNSELKLSSAHFSLGWLPVQVQFLAQGEGPYLLAYGSGEQAARDQSLGFSSLKEVIPDKSFEKTRGVVEVGVPVILGGDKALLPPKEPFAWKRWILWFVLIAGVAVLAYMVRTLLEDMKK